MQKVNRTSKKFVVALGLMLAAYGAGSALAAGEGPPPPPPWVDADGSVDLEKMPACVNVVDSEGELVRTSNGDLLCVDPRPLDGPRGEGAQDGDAIITVENGVESREDSTFLRGPESWTD